MSCLSQSTSASSSQQPEGATSLTVGHLTSSRRPSSILQDKPSTLIGRGDDEDSASQETDGIGHRIDSDLGPSGRPISAKGKGKARETNAGLLSPIVARGQDLQTPPSSPHARSRPGDAPNVGSVQPKGKGREKTCTPERAFSMTLETPDILSYHLGLPTPESPPPKPAPCALASPCPKFLPPHIADGSTNPLGCQHSTSSSLHAANLRRASSSKNALGLLKPDLGDPFAIDLSPSDSTNPERETDLGTSKSPPPAQSQIWAERGHNRSIPATRLDECRSSRTDLANSEGRCEADAPCSIPGTSAARRRPPGSVAPRLSRECRSASSGVGGSSLRTGGLSSSSLASWDRDSTFAGLELSHGSSSNTCGRLNSEAPVAETGQEARANMTPHQSISSHAMAASNSGKRSFEDSSITANGSSSFRGNCMGDVCGPESRGCSPSSSNQPRAENSQRPEAALPLTSAPQSFPEPTSPSSANKRHRSEGFFGSSSDRTEASSILEQPSLPASTEATASGEWDESNAPFRIASPSEQPGGSATSPQRRSHPDPISTVFPPAMAGPERLDSVQSEALGVESEQASPFSFGRDGMNRLPSHPERAESPSAVQSEIPRASVALDRHAIIMPRRTRSSLLSNTSTSAPVAEEASRVRDPRPLIQDIEMASSSLDSRSQGLDERGRGAAAANDPPQHRAHEAEEQETGLQRRTRAHPWMQTDTLVATGARNTTETENSNIPPQSSLSSRRSEGLTERLAELQAQVSHTASELAGWRERNTALLRRIRDQSSNGTRAAATAALENYGAHASQQPGTATSPPRVSRHTSVDRDEGSRQGPSLWGELSNEAAESTLTPATNFRGVAEIVEELRSVRNDLSRSIESRRNQNSANEAFVDRAITSGRIASEPSSRRVGAMSADGRLRGPTRLANEAWLGVRNQIESVNAPGPEIGGHSSSIGESPRNNAVWSRGLNSSSRETSADSLLRPIQLADSSPASPDADGQLEAEVLDATAAPRLPGIRSRSPLSLSFGDAATSTEDLSRRGETGRLYDQAGHLTASESQIIDLERPRQTPVGERGSNLEASPLSRVTPSSHQTNTQAANPAQDRDPTSTNTSIHSHPSRSGLRPLALSSRFGRQPRTTGSSTSLDSNYDFLYEGLGSSTRGLGSTSMLSAGSRGRRWFNPREDPEITRSIHSQERAELESFFEDNEEERRPDGMVSNDRRSSSQTLRRRSERGSDRDFNSAREMETERESDLFGIDSASSSPALERRTSEAISPAAHTMDWYEHLRIPQGSEPSRLRRGGHSHDSEQAGSNSLDETHRIPFNESDLLQHIARRRARRIELLTSRSSASSGVDRSAFEGRRSRIYESRSSSSSSAIPVFDRRNDPLFRSRDRDPISQSTNQGSGTSLFSSTSDRLLRRRFDLNLPESGDLDVDGDRDNSTPRRPSDHSITNDRDPGSRTSQSPSYRLDSVRNSSRPGDRTPLSNSSPGRFAYQPHLLSNSRYQSLSGMRELRRRLLAPEEDPESLRETSSQGPETGADADGGSRFGSLGYLGRSGRGLEVGRNRLSTTDGRSTNPAPSSSRSNTNSMAAEVRLSSETLRRQLGLESFMDSLGSSLWDAEDSAMINFFPLPRLLDSLPLSMDIASNPANYLADDEWNDSYENLLRISAQLGDVQPKNAPGHVVNGLPKCRYDKWSGGSCKDVLAEADTGSSETKAGKEKDTHCAICLEEYEKDDMVMSIPTCDHAFHESCLKVRRLFARIVARVRTLFLTVFFCILTWVFVHLALLALFLTSRTHHQTWFESARTCPFCRSDICDSGRTTRQRVDMMLPELNLI
ncbi:hypothetical protein IE53DRAFT_106437 [Violaceomyces palustris]|uniref:Uncharacterized protein n=1 Tax=Violaceomyces palustris TaxID=1673888 RepID=A0ACD0NWN9_9BASI|nr:hypothetical protein IE53DRAFT_106437 [Violaceomyces palustris]